MSENNMISNNRFNTNEFNTKIREFADEMIKRIKKDHEDYELDLHRESLNSYLIIIHKSRGIEAYQIRLTRNGEVETTSVYIF